LKLSTKALSVGLPGLEKSILALAGTFSHSSFKRSFYR
jgi:hypothetical protein